MSFQMRNPGICLFIVCILTIHSAIPALAQNSQQEKNNGPIANVKFMVFSAGIYPRTVHATEGLVGIAVEDLSGGTTELFVDRVTRTGRTNAGKIQRDRPRWRARTIIKLQPGTYEVYSPEHSSMRALLIVESK